MFDKTFDFVTVLCHAGLLNMKYCSDSLTQKLCHIGGQKLAAISYDAIKLYLHKDAPPHLASRVFRYIDHTKCQIDQYTDPHYVQIDIPLHILVHLIPVSAGRKIAELHGMKVSSCATSALLHTHLLSHSCHDVESLLLYCLSKRTRNKK
jgi:hypothetical protein